MGGEAVHPESPAGHRFLDPADAGLRRVQVPSDEDPGRAAMQRDGARTRQAPGRQDRAGGQAGDEGPVVTAGRGAVDPLPAVGAAHGRIDDPVRRFQVPYGAGQPDLAPGGSAIVGDVEIRAVGEPVPGVSEAQRGNATPRPRHGGGQRGRRGRDSLPGLAAVAGAQHRGARLGGAWRRAEDPALAGRHERDRLRLEVGRHRSSGRPGHGGRRGGGEWRP